LRQVAVPPAPTFGGLMRSARVKWDLERNLWMLRIKTVTLKALVRREATMRERIKR
jgi:hypothetical protein